MVEEAAALSEQAMYIRSHHDRQRVMSLYADYTVDLTITPSATARKCKAACNGARFGAPSLHRGRFRRAASHASCTA